MSLSHKFPSSGKRMLEEMIHPLINLWGLAGMGWFRESDPAPSPTSVILRMVRTD